MYVNELFPDVQLQLEQLLKMATGNPVSAVNLVPYEKRSIDRDSHRMSKASIPMSSLEVSSHVFRSLVIHLWYDIDWLTVPHLCLCYHVLQWLL